MVPSTKSRIPITIITGFVGSGKTTLILILLPQLRRKNPSYRLALIKNEIGDLSVDAQLAAAAELTATTELLGACICCTNVGQIGDALASLDSEYAPDRIVIETSGSAEPLKLVLEVNRLAKETGRYELDGVISVLDAENWAGYASSSFTAKLQARQTDLIVVNKWESLGEREWDLFLDRLGDLDVETPWVKSQKGRVSVDLLFGLDSKMAQSWGGDENGHAKGEKHQHGGGQTHDHNEEMECLSVMLSAKDERGKLDYSKLEQLLKDASKEEVYRMKAIVTANDPPLGVLEAEFSDASSGATNRSSRLTRYILNWSFGRYTWTRDSNGTQEEPLLRMSIFTARYESSKWQKRIEASQYITVAGERENSALTVKRVL